MAEQRTEPWGHAAHAYYDGWQKQLAALRAENSRLSAEVERMRGVLEAVEWEGYCIGDKACPDCNGLWLHEEHKPDCPLGRALGRPECGDTEHGH